MENMLGGTPRLWRTAHRTVRSTEPNSLVRPTRHTHRGIPFRLPTSRSLCNTTTISMVEVRGKKSHCSAGSIPSASQSSLRWGALILRRGFANMGHEGDAPRTTALCLILFLFSMAVVVSVHICGTPPLFQTATMMSGAYCSVLLSSSSSKMSASSQAGGASGPIALLFVVDRTASAVLDIGDAPSNAVDGGYALRWSMPSGPRLANLVFSFLAYPTRPSYPPHAPQ